MGPVHPLPSVGSPPSAAPDSTQSTQTSSAQLGSEQNKRRTIQKQKSVHILPKQNKQTQELRGASGGDQHTWSSEIRRKGEHSAPLTGSSRKLWDAATLQANALSKYEAQMQHIQQQMAQHNDRFDGAQFEVFNEKISVAKGLMDRFAEAFHQNKMPSAEQRLRQLEREVAALKQPMKRALRSLDQLMRKQVVDGNPVVYTKAAESTSTIVPHQTHDAGNLERNRRENGSAPEPHNAQTDRVNEVHADAVQPPAEQELDSIGKFLFECKNDLDFWSGHLEQTQTDIAKRQLAECADLTKQLQSAVARKEYHLEEELAPKLNQQLSVLQDSINQLDLQYRELQRDAGWLSQSNRVVTLPTGQFHKITQVSASEARLQEKRKNYQTLGWVGGLGGLTGGWLATGSLLAGTGIGLLGVPLLVAGYGLMSAIINGSQKLQTAYEKEIERQGPIVKNLQDLSQEGKNVITAQHPGSDARPTTFSQESGIQLRVLWQPFWAALKDERDLIWGTEQHASPFGSLELCKQAMRRLAEPMQEQGEGVVQEGGLTTIATNPAHGCVLVTKNDRSSGVVYL